MELFNLYALILWWKEARKKEYNQQVFMDSWLIVPPWQFKMSGLTSENGSNEGSVFKAWEIFAQYFIIIIIEGNVMLLDYDLVSWEHSVVLMYWWRAF